MLTLPLDRSVSSQCNDLYKICRVFGGSFGSVQEDFKGVFIYSHDVHLGHLTLTITNFHPPFQKMFHIKFGFDWPNCCREDV